MNKNERYERFLKAYADANPLLSKPIQQKNAKKLWCEVKEDAEKYDSMLNDFKIKQAQGKGNMMSKWANWSKVVNHEFGSVPQPSTSSSQPWPSSSTSEPSTSTPQPSTSTSQPDKDENAEEDIKEGCVLIVEFLYNSGAPINNMIYICDKNLLKRKHCIK